MSEKPWHKRYHSDAISGYMELTLEERGAYTTLLDMMYDRQGPVNVNERLLAGYFGVSIRKMRSLVDSLVSKGKIYRTDDGGLSNHRFEKELENELKTSRKHSENGSKGGRISAENKKKDNEINDGDQARLKQNSSLYQKPDTRISSVVSTVVPDIAANPPKPPSRDRTELDRIEAALRFAAGLENSPAPGLCVLAPILGLLDAGYSLEEDVLPVVRSKAGRKVSSWSYFVQAIRDGRELRLKSGSIPAPASSEIDSSKVESGYRLMVSDWKKSGRWTARTPEPGKPGCTVPAAILSEFGIATDAQRMGEAA